MALNALPMPARDPIAEIAEASPRGESTDERIAWLERAMRSLRLGNTWILWLSSIAQTVSTQPARIKAVSSTGQSASIAATDLTDGGASQGLYRLTYYARITHAGTVTSSLTVIFAWTDGGVPQTVSGTAMVANTTTTVQSGTLLIYSDAVSPITVATAYAANAASSMQYRLDTTLERVAA